MNTTFKRGIVAVALITGISAAGPALAHAEAAPGAAASPIELVDPPAPDFGSSTGSVTGVAYLLALLLCATGQGQCGI